MKLSLLFFAMLSSLYCLGQDANLSYRITGSSDDAEERLGIVDATDLEIDLGSEDSIALWGGFHFRSIAVKSMAQVKSSSLVLTLKSEITDSVDLTIRLEESVYPELFDSNSNISDRATTSEEISWTVLASDVTSKIENPGNNLPDDTIYQITSPDLSTLIEPLLSTTDWEPGRSLSFIITPTATSDSSNKVEVYSFDQTLEYRRPILNVSVDSTDLDTSALNGVGRIEAPSISFYPNPTTGLLNVETDDYGTVVIYDSKGALIAHESVNAGQNQLNVEFLLPGIYTVMYRNDHNPRFSSARLVKN